MEFKYRDNDYFNSEDNYIFYISPYLIITSSVQFYNGNWYMKGNVYPLGNIVEYKACTVKCCQIIAPC